MLGQRAATLERPGCRPCLQAGVTQACGKIVWSKLGSCVSGLVRIRDNNTMARCDVDAVEAGQMMTQNIRRSEAERKRGG